MSFRAVIRTILMTSKLNVLLIFVPVGITFNFIPGMPAVLVFACNTIALVPLSSLLAYATECIASDLGDTIGALINISLGNLIELITLFVALKEGKVHIVQGALVGSILVNLLLVLGCAIIVGDFLAADLEQQFDVSHAQALACLLALSVMSILIPIGFHYSMDDQDAANYAVSSMSRISAVILLFVYAVYVSFLLRPQRRHARPVSVEDGSGHLAAGSHEDLGADRLPASRTVKFADDGRNTRHRRGESIEMSGLSSQASRTHKNEEDEDDEDSTESDDDGTSPNRPAARASKSTNTDSLSRVPSNTSGPSSTSRISSHSRSRSRSLTMPGAQHMDLMGRYMRRDSLANDTDDIISTGQISSSAQHRRAGSSSVDMTHNLSSGSANGQLSMVSSHSATALVATLAAPLEENLPQISRNASLLLLVGASILTAICAEFIVANIEQVTAATGFSKAFIGLIVLPIAGNAAEFITAISVAAVGKADLALGVSFGSSIQISLFVAPLMILGGWILDQDMTLDFGVFDTIALIGSALVVNVLITNGRSNYLEGCLLVACYLMVA
ncbi:Sodium/calcium exchanger protein-domain-containing protein [Microdochium trichocladiopsis]|uniref:Sodium/calcium exchanger protein-domain-containing protein n=1 Tax=Microdochium trichocladiopsis TaxID=1682393 RepID=A0A9P8XZF7_9PEZI|nr:Sodium/calcium exchanger protein-domain-containing protein [Microdochium trichocladiopsis]KAH7025686.1 Sodium/calcium exchanger protein-domain-containing protein [Microdochium trichocladiopsis]